MNNMYNYVFHYNSFNQIWSAIPRSKYSEYWNNPDMKDVLKSKDIKVLIELINKGEDFIKSISVKNK